ncbi:uncharacterized protein LOC110039544 [Phalaenopsis equestris]|uniref:uncharacterized protein LOC110039544 n=1 Tax=Phalaenopsis equestris TaxID=78828 RepID=UPI0009E2890A|nr:uncharacterized protein LOC110039544 [Phalaenopsis equestris]
MQSSQESTSPCLEDCLNLLRGERDEQKLAGLLLATRLSKGDDHAAILSIYKAVGARFLHRLLITGAGSLKGGADKDAYLKLSVTLLAGFCRVPEIASSQEMISEVPIIAEIISNSSDPSIFEECYEFLLLVASASENAITQIIESGSIQPLARHISFLPNDSRSLEHSVRLLELILDKMPTESMDKRYLVGMPWMVASLSRQFAVLHNALKFDVMHMLTTLLCSRNVLFHEALRELSRENWAAYIRIGIMEILQNRIVSYEKLQALQLLDSIMHIIGEGWLLEEKIMLDVQETLPVDKFLLLVLERARVEVSVILNELAYLKYEASKSSTSESVLSKQQNLAVLYSLIEKIIKLISSSAETEGTSTSEAIVMQIISGLNETVDLVLDYLQDAKDHCYRKGNDLLAAVRIVGSYLAEAPFACKEKTQDLLQYLLSVEGEDEPSPFYSVCFLLPMLCQTTMETDGCKALASFGGHKTVVECLVKLLGRNGDFVEDIGTIYLACDIILNLLLRRKELGSQIDGFQFLILLQGLCSWAEKSNDPSAIMMTSSVCALVFDLTSEKNLLNHPEFSHSTLERLSRLIIRSLGQGLLKDESNAHHDLLQIIRSGLWIFLFCIPCNSPLIFHLPGKIATFLFVQSNSPAPPRREGKDRTPFRKRLLGWKSSSQAASKPPRFSPGVPLRLANSASREQCCSSRASILPGPHSLQDRVRFTNRNSAIPSPWSACLPRFLRDSFSRAASS